MGKDIKKQILELAERVGKHEARRLLVDAGLSTSTAEKLVGGRYHCDIKELTRQAIIRAFEARKSA